jgi:FG-GAP-like repeat
MKKIFFFVFLAHFINGCSLSEKKTVNEEPKATNFTGEALARIHCASCHLFPEPDLLDKKTWKNGVLPAMSYHLGMGDLMAFVSKIPYEDIQLVMNSNAYPSQPVLAKEDWQKIIDFYVDNAPEKPLPQTSKLEPLVGLKQFDIEPVFAPKIVPMITMLKIIPKKQQFYAAYRASQSGLFVFDSKQNCMDSFKLKNPVSDVRNTEGGDLQMLLMGVMDPNDGHAGEWISFNKGKQTMLLDSLQRPVQMSFGDLNQDGKEDIVLCLHGNDVGKLVWYEGGTMKEHVLRPLPGARTTVLCDMNKDGLLDIIALMGQAREGIFMYLNQGNGTFEESDLLTFQSVFGSSYFEMVDFNNDGFLDILYTNGDNADYSYILKRFHGVHIFLNDGKNAFKETYFYPMYGASKAMASDFDGDGDLDIAAISFFPDVNQKPNEGFLLFDNQGNMNFKISTMNEARLGKWMVMDVGDIDNDGDKDIVLGSFLRGGLGKFTTDKKEKLPSILILKNRRIKK